MRKLKESQAPNPPNRILAFATQGAGGDEEGRLRELLSRLSVQFLEFDRADRVGSLRLIIRSIRECRPLLVVVEGSGAAGGLSLLLARLIYGTRYVVSSGDAICPFLSARWPALKLLFYLYERLLYRYCSGFIGWTPYLVGRALTMGAPKGMTAAGWAPVNPDAATRDRQGRQVREQLGIPADAIVFGLVGAIIWTSRYRYCYGWELVTALLRQTKSPKVCVLIVGDGDGLRHLKEIAGNRLGTTIFLPGRVGRHEIPAYLAAMDIGSLPQSVDGVGSFRYSTKLSEYVSARLPFVTNQIPAAYDLDDGELWRLPGQAPWEKTFIDALAGLMASVTEDEIRHKRASVARVEHLFEKEFQVARVTEFINEILVESKDV